MLELDHAPCDATTSKVKVAERSQFKVTERSRIEFTENSLLWSQNGCQVITVDTPVINGTTILKSVEEEDVGFDKRKYSAFQGRWHG